MDDDQLIEELLVRIACILEDTSALLLVKHDTRLVDRVTAARIAVDRADVLTGPAEAIAKFADASLAER